MKYNYKNLSKREIKRIIKRNSLCFLGVNDFLSPYIFPMFYIFNTDSEEEIILELLTKDSGKKIDYFIENDDVSVLIYKKILKKSYSILLKGKVYLNSDDMNGLNMIKIIINVKECEGRLYYY